MDSFPQVRVKALDEATKGLTSGQGLKMHLRGRENCHTKEEQRGCIWHYYWVGKIYTVANFKVSASLFLPRENESDYLF